MSDETQKPDQEVVFPEHLSEVTGSDGTEVIVYDLNEDGKAIGWHKEPRGTK